MGFTWCNEQDKDITELVPMEFGIGWSFSGSTYTNTSQM